MRIGGGGSADTNLLQSDAAQFRNEDFVVAQAGSFAGGVQQAAVAAEYPHVQIFNPAMSGVVVMIDAIVVSSDSALIAVPSLYDTELTTDDGAWSNLLSGSAAGAAHMRKESLGSLTGPSLVSAYMAANDPWTFHFKYPIQLGSGKGLLVRGTVVNTNLAASFYGREV